MENSRFFTAKNISLLGILTALVVVLQLFASAIPMFGITLNFSLIPIAFAGIMLGWAGGAFVGFASGLVVFITMAVMGQEPFTAYLFQASPFVLTAVCLAKTTLAGAVSGLLFKPVAKRNFLVASVLSSAVIPVVNTGIYMLGIFLMRNSAVVPLDLPSAEYVFAAVFALVWVNFLLETAINIIFSPVIYRVAKIYNGNRG